MKKNYGIYKVLQFSYSLCDFTIKYVYFALRIKKWDIIFLKYNSLICQVPDIIVINFVHLSNINKFLIL